MIGTAGKVDTVHVETVIVGAGPAGLGVAACLRRVGVPFVILERDGGVGAAWRRHYDNLCLHTDKARSALPYLPFPEQYPKFVSREQVVDYLESYARRFGLEPRFGQNVLSARLRDGRWHTRTEDTVYVSRHLVVATGYNTLPHIPTWPGQETFEGTIIHSSTYKNAAPYKGKRVLVVGFGNSGSDIVRDLWQHGARPTLSIRNPVNLVLPRECMGIPILAIAILLQKLPGRLANAVIATIVRVMFGDLSRLTLCKPPYQAFATDYPWSTIVQTALRKPPYGPVAQRSEHVRVPLIDTGGIDLIRSGHIKAHPGIERFAGRDVVFTDGTRQRFDAVLLATGYRTAVSFLEQAYQPTEEFGKPRPIQSEGRVPGLHFVGFYIPATGMLRELGIQGRQIAQEIAQSIPRQQPPARLREKAARAV